MKNYILIATAAFLASACNQAELEKAKHTNDSLVSVNNSLQSVVYERDSSLNDFITAFNEVERNLDSVALRQNIISTHSDKPGELKANQKARINDEIAAINTLMEQNHKKLAELTRKQKNSAQKNVELEKLIATINNQLVQKDNELAALNVRLTALNSQVDQLQTYVIELAGDNYEQSQTIAEDTKALHTAYYVIGKSKELQDQKIIDREGGLLGIGRTSKLSAEVDNSKFTRIDFTMTKTIPVNSGMKIITTHPADSYTLEKADKNKNTVSNIVITDPEKFWSASKYLVVVKD